MLKLLSLGVQSARFFGVHLFRFFLALLSLRLALARFGLVMAADKFMLIKNVFEKYASEQLLCIIVRRVTNIVIKDIKKTHTHKQRETKTP